MQRRLSSTALVLAVSVVIAALAGGNAYSQPASPLPAPTGFVNDYAGVIDEDTKQRLEEKLRSFKEKSSPSAEIAVAVVRTTGDQPIFEYSLAVARGWGIGSKDDDNPSALLLIAIDDRKYFTQVSRDLEDELPDGLVGSLQRQFLVPEFRKQNYAKGISDTLDAYMATIERKGGVGAAPAERKRGPDASGGLGTGTIGTFCCLAIGLVLVVLIFGRGRGGPSAKDQSRWGGGAFGSGRRRSGIEDALPWIIGSAIGSSLGSSGSSSSSDWGSSGGSDWGGFGGGGDFGGGGAGGGW